MKKRLGVLPCFDPKRFFVVTLSPHTRVTISLPLPQPDSRTWHFRKWHLPDKGNHLGQSPCHLFAFRTNIFINLKKKIYFSVFGHRIWTKKAGFDIPSGFWVLIGSALGMNIGFSTLPLCLNCIAIMPFLHKLKHIVTEDTNSPMERK